MKKLIIFLSFLYLAPALADNSGFSLTEGQFTIGESRIPIDPKDFKIVVENFVSGPKISAGFVKDSFQWIRTNDNLLIPRARLGVRIFSTSTDIYIKYDEQNLLPVDKTKYLFSEFFIPLYSSKKIEIFKGKTKIASILILAQSNKSNKEKHYIDYSCSPYHLAITGIESEYFSIVCNMGRLGLMGSEKPLLKLIWASTNLTLPDGTSPPFTTFLTNEFPIKITMINEKKENKLITITAQIPKELKRIKTALGFGPYSLVLKEDGSYTKKSTAPALMLYGKFDLLKNSSFRFFDAIVANKGLFNHLGIYFAYELASIYDNRFQIIPLLGLQAITYKFDSSTKSYNQLIYPQGFEAVYQHAFGLENYSLIYGMFLSTETDVTYKNLWVRFGKKTFYEVNYIEWSFENRSVKTWGLSVGLPFMSFL